MSLRRRHQVNVTEHSIWALQFASIVIAWSQFLQHFTYSNIQQVNRLCWHCLHMEHVVDECAEKFQDTLALKNEQEKGILS